MQENKLQELLDSLSLTEKIGQLVQVPGEVLNAEGQELGVREDLGLSEELARNVGSTLNVVGAQRVRAVQKAYLERSRHKIPLLFMADIIYVPCFKYALCLYIKRWSVYVPCMMSIRLV